MRKFVVAALASAALLAAGGSAQASATIYHDRAEFAAAVGALTTDMFASAGSCCDFIGDHYDSVDFAIDDDNAGAFVVRSNFDPLFNWGGGSVFDAEFGILTITARFGVKALGFDFGNPACCTDLYTHPASPVSINGVEYGGFSQPTFAFYGIVSDETVAPIIVNFNGGLGIIDNVSTPGGVPEPSAWALMIAGFGLVGAAVRRRRALAA